MSNSSVPILELLRRVRAIAQNGLAYSEGYFDRERYQELYDLSTEGVANLAGVEPSILFIPDDDKTGYATPKVGTRGALFRGNDVLLVRERNDDRWALPGGWVDVNDSPSEAIAKEFVQETGLTVRPYHLCKIIDGGKRNRLSPHHVYTLVFLCEYLEGELTPSYETTEVRYFPIDQLPELSISRTSPEYIKTAWAHYRNQVVEAEFD
jgi:ADP-ribose pyrophosphatase YjhB (NUDIX family)